MSVNITIQYGIPVPVKKNLIQVSVQHVEFNPTLQVLSSIPD